MEISDKLTYAIIGASNNSDKFGHKVLKNLVERGYSCIPVNPKEDEILGLKVYKSLKDIEQTVDVVVTIVPPQITESIVEHVIELGIKNIWMQPGSESEKAIQIAEQSGVEVVSGACIMFS